MADGGMSPGMSRAEFSRLMERALMEADASLHGEPDGVLSAQPLTAQDWWEVLTEVVMPELLMETAGER